MTPLPTPRVADLIEAATLQLREAGVTKPRREANRLWAWLHRTSPGAVWLGQAAAAAPDRRREYEQAVARRALGEPLDYVLGWSGFRRLELRCDRRALIPRPESEGVVEHALARVRRGRAADLGTGSGCLALALCDEGGFSEVVATDISPAALALAAENVAATRLPVRLVRGDFGVALRTGVFDLVVSNPPYLTEAEHGALDPAVARWEPPLALQSGPDGLESTRRVLDDGARLLVAGGWLVMELDSSRGSAACALAAARGFSGVTLHEDLFGRPRYLVAQGEGRRS